MKNVKIIEAGKEFLEEVSSLMPVFNEADYIQRLQLLTERLGKAGLTHAVIYADREHFANMEYLIGFEPRFEEALLIVNINAECTVITGNECIPYSYISPVKFSRILYQNFSLQGQPRDKVRPLKDIFIDCGISEAQNSKVGMIGFKYFEQEHQLGDPEKVFDVPAYIVDELRAAAGNQNVINFTRVMTGMPDGIRMTVRTAKEVAWAEYAACKTTNIIQRILKNLRSGISEIELSQKSGIDFSPISVFPMLNFGAGHGSVGLRSPDSKTLEVGEPCGMCYGMRGSLVSRVGLAAYDEATMRNEYKGVTDSFYKPFWEAIATWYEALYIGVPAKDVYQKVMDIIGAPEFGVVLNPGHYIGGDEWVNSPFSKDSEIMLTNSAHMQCDIIVSSGNPVMSGICEDSIVLADKKLREEVSVQYPEVWERISKRQQLMREVLGIAINDDVLPLGNLNGVFFPYMLDCNKIFSAL